MSPPREETAVCGKNDVQVLSEIPRDDLDGCGTPLMENPCEECNAALGITCHPRSFWWRTRSAGKNLSLPGQSPSAPRHPIEDVTPRSPLGDVSRAQENRENSQPSANFTLEVGVSRRTEGSTMPPVTVGKLVVDYTNPLPKLEGGTAHLLVRPRDGHLVVSSSAREPEKNAIAEFEIVLRDRRGHVVPVQIAKPRRDSETTPKAAGGVPFERTCYDYGQRGLIRSSLTDNTDYDSV